MPRNRGDHSDPYMNMNRNNGYNNGKKPGMNMKKVFGISFAIVMGVVLISGGLVYKLGHGLYSNINYVADEDIQTVETLPEEIIEEETLSTEERTGVVVSDEELNSIHDKMKNLAVETVSDDDIYNVLLIGVDRRDKSWNGNSDAMLLVSINKDKNKVSVISLMRDTYVDIPGIGYKKLNAAYAYGAGPLLCETVTDTYKIDIDRYAAVDFFDLIGIIDLIGGVSLEISPKEAEVANGYILDMCNLMDVDGWEHQIPESGGFIRCDGVQAVAFARNRYVGNSDFERTERQRYVLTQLMAEVKQLSLAQMTEKMQGLMQYVTTNIPETEIWSMLAEIPEILEYEFEMTRVPYDNMYSVIYVNGQDMLVPDWEPTLNQMHNTIYGNTAGETAVE